MAQFTIPTFQEVYDRMKADAESRPRQNGPVALLARVVENIFLLVFAGAIYGCYLAVVRLGEQLFYNTADSNYLADHMTLNGLNIKPATRASGTGRFFLTGTPPIVIVQGSEITDTNGLIFRTTEEETLTGVYIDIVVEALLAGAGCASDAEKMELVTPISGVNNTIEMVVKTTGGTDVESEEDQITRLYQLKQNPPKSGSIGDYERWTLSVAGVGRAWVFPADKWVGAGTVGVLFATNELEVVSPTVKQNVEDYVESVRPVVALVDYVDPEILDVDYFIDIDPNITTYQDLIDDALRDLHFFEATPGGTILLTRINTEIGKTNVTNFEITDIKVNDVSVGVTDLTSTGIQLLRFRSVTYSDLT